MQDMLLQATALPNAPSEIECLAANDKVNCESYRYRQEFYHHYTQTYHGQK